MARRSRSRSDCDASRCGPLTKDAPATAFAGGDAGDALSIGCRPSRTCVGHAAGPHGLKMSFTIPTFLAHRPRARRESTARSRSRFVSTTNVLGVIECFTQRRCDPGYGPASDDVDASAIKSGSSWAASGEDRGHGGTDDALAPFWIRALDAIIGMDHRGMITEFNPAAERMFGYSRAEDVWVESWPTLADSAGTSRKPSRRSGALPGDRRRAVHRSSHRNDRVPCGRPRVPRRSLDHERARRRSTADSRALFGT